MEIIFMILAFIGTFSCGFFTCLALILAAAIKRPYRRVKRGGNRWL